MDKHHFRITLLFTGFGLISGIVLLLISPTLIENFKEVNSYFGDSRLTNLQRFLLLCASLIPPLAIIGGILHYLKHKLSEILLLITSFIFLFAFPLGTIVAIYYFWYKFSYLKQDITKFS